MVALVAVRSAGGAAPAASLPRTKPLNSLKQLPTGSRSMSSRQIIACLLVRAATGLVAPTKQALRVAEGAEDWRVDAAAALPVHAASTTTRPPTTASLYSGSVAAKATPALPNAEAPPPVRALVTFAGVVAGAAAIGFDVELAADRPVELRRRRLAVLVLAAEGVDTGAGQHCGSGGGQGLALQQQVAQPGHLARGGGVLGLAPFSAAGEGGVDSTGKLVGGLHCGDGRRGHVHARFSAAACVYGSGF